MDGLRKLSEVKKKEDLLAYCAHCKETFIDDTGNYNPIICPVCSWPHALERKVITRTYVFKDIECVTTSGEWNAYP